MSKKKNPLNNNPFRDRKLLEHAGYLVDEMSPWHWHIRKPGYPLVVNVWPTAMKYMQDGSSGSNRYVDVVKSVNGIFTNYEHNHGDRLRAEKEVIDLRQGGLEYIKRRLKEND